MNNSEIYHEYLKAISRYNALVFQEQTYQHINEELSRKGYENLCRRFAYPIANHVCYICCLEFHMSLTINHWVTEIKNFILPLDRNEFTSSNITKSEVVYTQIFEYVFGSNFEYIHQVFKNALTDEMKEGKKKKDDRYKIIEEKVLPYIDDYAESNKLRIKHFYERITNFLDRYKTQDNDPSEEILNIIKYDLVEYYPW